MGYHSESCSLHFSHDGYNELFDKGLSQKWGIDGNQHPSQPICYYFHLNELINDGGVCSYLVSPICESRRASALSPRLLEILPY